MTTYAAVVSFMMVIGFVLLTVGMIMGTDDGAKPGMAGFVMFLCGVVGFALPVVFRVVCWAIGATP